MGVEIRGVRRGISQLEQAARNLEQRLPAAMKAVGEALVAHVQENFEGQHDSYGKPWAPLSGKTVYKRITRGGKKAFGRRRRVVERHTTRGFEEFSHRSTTLTAHAERIVGNAKILIDTQALRGGINSRSDDHSAVVGFGGPHAGLAVHHHYGTRTIPARGLLPLDDAGRANLPQELHDEIVATIMDAIHAGVRDRGAVSITAGARGTR